jgi:hypothetical protein
MSKWANKPRSNDTAAEKQVALWDSLNRFVDERGGSITSPMHVWPVRLQVDPESPLPAKLQELGYRLRFVCQETRIGPVFAEWTRNGRRVDRNDAYGFRTVNVYELQAYASEPYKSGDRIKVV